MNYTTPPQIYPNQDFTPDKEEKARILKNYNIIGIVLLVSYLLMTVICTVCSEIFCPEIVYNEDGMIVIGFEQLIIGGCFPAVISILTFAGYCLFTRYKPGELFSTERVRGSVVFRYAMIILMLQQVSFLCMIILSSALYSIGLEVPSMNMVYEHTPSVYIVDIIASVILAPVAEELIYRGIVLRCTARISQHFAVFFSAFVFGIMHGNPYQFILGFILGIPLAIVTIRSGSLIPAILCHMINNAVASIPSIIQYFNEDIMVLVEIIYIPLFLIAGAFVFFPEFCSGRMKLPAYTEYHRRRTLPVMITSWSIIVVMLLFVQELIFSIQPVVVQQYKYF